MKDFSQYKNVGKTSNTDYYIAESDSDILIVVPHEGTVDNPKDARENVIFQSGYARSLEKKCSTLVVLAALVAQDAETRRIYASEMENDLFFAAALVVDSALSRAIGSFFIGLSRPQMPTKLFDTTDKATAWLKTMRPA